MPHLTTHVLDASTGAPAAEVGLALTGPDGSVIADGATDDDGRAGLGPDLLAPGDYTLRFATREHFAARGVDAFYPFVSVTFTVADDRHLHVPILLSPFAYSTYRGS